MAASVFESPMFAKLFPTGDAGRLFTDAADVRAMMLVEGTLAKVQGELGVIPQDSAFFIQRAAMECQIDPAGLAPEIGQNGVSVPSLVAAFRKAMEAPEHAQYIHWGATSQDIIDTALMLRLRQLLAICDKDLQTILTTLAALANMHAETPMAARTWGQHATLTSFGAQVAEWGNPLLSLHEELPELRNSCLMVSLSGAAGTSSALPDPVKTRTALAKALNLQDPGRSWHTDRTPILRIGDWLNRLTQALAKIGDDLIAAAQSGIEEITLSQSGSSSTMPQKQNPVGPSALVALAHQSAGLSAILSNASVHKHQRDGAALFSEWMSLPQICLSAAAALSIVKSIAPQIAPDADRMKSTIPDLIYSEALSFALVAHMRRPEAQEAVKTLAAESRASGVTLASLAQARWPQLDLSKAFDLAIQMGQAPALARDFANRANALISQEAPE